ncbi:PepSY domain-containing protein [Gordonia sinesedis]
MSTTESSAPAPAGRADTADGDVDADADRGPDVVAESGSTTKRDAAPEHPRPSSAAWQRWRPLLLRWHFYAGLLVGPFLLLAAVTGLLYAVVPQIDSAVYRHELTVDRVGSERVPLAQQVAAARATHPEGTVTSVTPADAADATTRVALAVDDVPEGYGRTVFVDPYSGEVRGALTTYGQWLPVRAWFDELHRNLHLGDIGRNYSELAASWLWVIALGGLVLWIGHRRRTGKARRLLVPDRDAQRRQRTLSWHGAVGIWIAVGLFALAASGLSWSRYAGDNIAELRAAMSWSTPSVTTAADPAAAAAAGGHVGHGAPSPAAALPETQALAGIDRAYAAARAAGLADPMNLVPPAAAGDAWSATENKRDAPTRYDSVAVDPDTGRVVDRVDFAQWPLTAKLTEWIINAHMGVLFGLVNQIVLAVLALGLITVIVRGYLMWWRRRPSSARTAASRRKLPAAPPAGALARLRPVEAVALVVVVAGLGMVVPLLGIPLAAFLLIDTARGIVVGRQGRRYAGSNNGGRGRRDADRQTGPGGTLTGSRTEGNT